MSTIIMSQCWPLQGLSVTQKAVLISLADQANDEGVCWPKVETIAVRCCLSERAVRSAMDHLELVRLLQRARRFNTSTVYTVTPQTFDADAKPSKGKRKLAKSVAEPGAGGERGAWGAPAAAQAAPGAGQAAPGAGLEVHGAPFNRNTTLIEPSEEPPSPAGLTAAPPVMDPEAELQAACKATWVAYATAYSERHGVAPVRNAKINANVKQLVQRLGYSEAPLVAAWFLTVNERYVVQNMHDLGTLLAKCEGYRTQWATGRQMTQASAQQQDQTQSNANAADDAKALLRRLKGSANAQ